MPSRWPSYLGGIEVEKSIVITEERRPRRRLSKPRTSHNSRPTSRDPSRDGQPSTSRSSSRSGWLGRLSRRNSNSDVSAMGPPPSYSNGSLPVPKLKGSYVHLPGSYYFGDFPRSSKHSQEDFSDDERDSSTPARSTPVSDHSSTRRNPLSRAGTHLSKTSKRMSFTSLKRSYSKGSLQAEAARHDQENEEEVLDKIREKAFLDNLFAENHVAQCLAGTGDTSGFTSPMRRRSLFTPGLATRAGSDILAKPHHAFGTPMEQVVSWDSNHPLEAAAERRRLSQFDSLDLASADGANMELIRAETPADLSYSHIGAFQLGSLRITNGRTDSPVPVETRSIMTRKSSPDLGADYFTASEGELEDEDEADDESDDGDYHSLYLPDNLLSAKQSIMMLARTTSGSPLKRELTSSRSSSLAQEYIKEIRSSPFDSPSRRQSMEQEAAPSSISADNMSRGEEQIIPGDFKAGTIANDIPMESSKVPENPGTHMPASLTKADSGVNSATSTKKTSEVISPFDDALMGGIRRSLTKTSRRLSGSFVAVAPRNLPNTRKSMLVRLASHVKKTKEVEAPIMSPVEEKIAQKAKEITNESAPSSRPVSQTGPPAPPQNVYRKPFDDDLFAGVRKSLSMATRVAAAPALKVKQMTPKRSRPSTATSEAVARTAVPWVRVDLTDRPKLSTSDSVGAQSDRSDLSHDSTTTVPTPMSLVDPTPKVLAAVPAPAPPPMLRAATSPPTLLSTGSSYEGTTIPSIPLALLTRHRERMQAFVIQEEDEYNLTELPEPKEDSQPPAEYVPSSTLARNSPPIPSKSPRRNSHVQHDQNSRQATVEDASDSSTRSSTSDDLPAKSSKSRTLMFAEQSPTIISPAPAPAAPTLDLLRSPAYETLSESVDLPKPLFYARRNSLISDVDGSRKASDASSASSLAAEAPQVPSQSLSRSDSPRRPWPQQRKKINPAGLGSKNLRAYSAPLDAIGAPSVRSISGMKVMGRKMGKALKDRPIEGVPEAVVMLPVAREPTRVLGFKAFEDDEDYEDYEDDIEVGEEAIGVQQSVAV